MRKVKTKTGVEVQNVYRAPGAALVVKDESGYQQYLREVSEISKKKELEHKVETLNIEIKTVKDELTDMKNLLSQILKVIEKNGN